MEHSQRPRSPWLARRAPAPEAGAPGGGRALAGSEAPWHLARGPVARVAAVQPPPPLPPVRGQSGYSEAAAAVGVSKSLETLAKRVEALEAQARQHGATIELLRLENKGLKRSVLLWDLARVRAHSKPRSVLEHPEPKCWPQSPSLLTVMRLEGFEKLITHCVTPATRNRRFAGKVGWNKLQKTCRDLRYAPVSLELDPSVRIVPDNFPTIRRAVQNVDKHDPLDQGRVLIRPRPEPYVEQVIVDRRVALMADPTAVAMPVIHGRLCIDEAAGSSVVRGLAVRNTNPRDPWGSAIDISGARGVLVEACELSSSANDETVLNLYGGCIATVRRNTIRGGDAHGVTGISIDGAATATVVENTISDNDVGVRLQPSGTATIRGNLFARNQKGLQLNDSGLEAIVEQGGFGRIMLRNNTFVDNRDGHNDASFLQSLEVLLHPLLRRFSMASMGSEIGLLPEEEEQGRVQESRSPDAAQKAGLGS
mmetsp:Transcript_101034/g.314192  ORF Transcript_101034/g.314192 Transcript_101034/m.314192 type:complete len:480 (-) Transcript_101034:33-1472(-)